MKIRVPSLKEKATPVKIKSVVKRDRPSTEIRLLKAGTAIFSKFGYDGATTKLIASKSGVNESLIMRYFGGKEGLLLEILKRHFEESRTTPLPYPPQDSLQAELSLYIRYGHENAKKHNEIYRIMLLRASIDLSVRRKVQALLPMDGDPKLLERISLLKSKGEIPANLDPKLAALVGFQNFTSVFIAGFLFDEAIQKEMQINLEKLVSTTVSGLIKF